MRAIPLRFGICYAVFVCLVGIGQIMSQDDVYYIRRVDKLRYIAFVPAKERCENWAIASALQSALEMEGIPLPQSELVVKVSGTDACGPNIKLPSELVNVIKGEYKLASGRTVHVQAQALDTFVDPGRLIASIRDNRPFLLIWNDRTYMAVGIAYLDAVHASGLHEYDIQQIELLDPFAGAEQQPTVFQKSQTTLAQVRGIIEITASK